MRSGSTPKADISWRVAPRPASEIETAAREDVEHRGTFADPDRVVVPEGQAHDSVPDPDTFGLRGDPGEEDLRCAHVRVAQEAVVLDGPDPVEAHLLGQHRLVDAFTDDPVLALACRERELRLEDHRELHDVYPRG